MTFSICARERYLDAEGTAQYRFGVAVTTRVPGVGGRCPFVSPHGAIATQGIVNPELGAKGVDYLADGVAIDDALGALLNADDGAADRQLHGVDRDGTFVFSGEECHPWTGHHDGGRFTVAGNLLVDDAVLDAVIAAYESNAPPAGRPTDRLDRQPFPKRLIDALDAGHSAGGDRRTDLDVQSAAIAIGTTEISPTTPAVHDLRVDATGTPIADLRETYTLAVKGYATVRNRDKSTDGNDVIG